MRLPRILSPDPTPPDHQSAIRQHYSQTCPPWVAVLIRRLRDRLPPVSHYAIFQGVYSSASITESSVSARQGTKTSASVNILTPI